MPSFFTQHFPKVHASVFHQVLSIHGIQALPISGKMTPSQHQRTLDQFSDPKSTITVLLSSDVGAVGLNIQAANIILMIVSDSLNPNTW